MSTVPVVMGFAAALALSGCVGLAALAPSADDATAAADATFPPATPFAIEDAAGDAADTGVSRLGYGPACLIGCQPLPGVDAPAGGDGIFDISSVALVEERPDSLVLGVGLSRLTEGFPELREPRADRRVAEYSACWTPAPDAAERCAVLDAAPNGDAATMAASFHIVGADACNDWSWCVWQIAADVAYGEPAEIRFVVPKALAAADGAPLAVGELRASAGWFSTNKAVPLWHVAWTVHANGDHEHDHVGILEPAHLADVAHGEHQAVGLSAPSAASATGPRAPVMTPGLGNLAGGGGIRDHAELDLVSFDLREEGTDLVASYAMAKFDAVPEYDLQFATIFGVLADTTYEVGLMTVSGETYGYAGRCVSFGCHDGFLVQVPYEVLPGGVVEVRAPRAIWEGLLGGGVVDLMIAYTMYGEVNVDVGTAGAPVYGNVHTGSIVDIALGGAPFAIGALDVEAEEAPHHH